MINNNAFSMLSNVRSDNLLNKECHFDGLSANASEHRTNNSGMTDAEFLNFLHVHPELWGTVMQILNDHKAKHTPAG